MMMPRVCVCVGPLLFAGAVCAVTPNEAASAANVSTAQTSAVATEISNASIQASQSVANAAQQISTSEQKAAARDRYGVEGQSMDPCYQNGMAITASKTSQSTTANAMKAASDVYRLSDYGDRASSGLSGFLGGRTQETQFPFAASMVKRTQRHQERYCTTAESASGFCTLQPNGMQGGDADFSLHGAPGKTFGWDQTEAATDYVKTLAPVNPLKTRERCDNEACRASLRNRIASEARMSMARFSMLRFVQSRTTQEAGDASKSAGQ